MTEEEKYRFDLQGYLVIENAIAPDVVKKMNAWLDKQAEKQKAWRGQKPSRHLERDRVLTWSKEFRGLVDNPRILPYLKALMGEEVRLDHDYAIFLKPGGTGLKLHCGGTPYDPSQAYHYHNGKMFSALTVVAYSLTDVPAGKGGMACIPGSHKSNFACPEDVMTLERSSPLVQQIPTKAGDCVLFTEAVTHGTLPWTGKGVRRTLFFKYSPGHMSYANGYYFPGPRNRALKPIQSKFTESQLRLLRAPGLEWYRTGIYESEEEDS